MTWHKLGIPKLTLPSTPASCLALPEAAVALGLDAAQQAVHDLRPYAVHDAGGPSEAVAQHVHALQVVADQ